MKILDRYILITYLRTFLSVFIIFMFIFILQGVWLYISELAGKELDVAVTAKFIIYYMPKLIPLVVPLTVLLSSIMVFGNFAENYEFAAMKSTGISLQRAMRSLSVFIVGLGIACFFFANNVIPWGEYNFYNLRRNIAKVKPALAIAEGQFNEIGDINIKVGEKTGENGQFLKNVVIHQKSNTKSGNFKIIVADEGELKSGLDSNILQLELKDGNYYEEIIGKNSRSNYNKPHARSYFKSYTINVDLEILNSDELDEKKHKGRHSMQNISQLSNTIDSLNTKKIDDNKKLSKTLFSRSTFQSLNLNIDTTNIKDTYKKDSLISLFGNRNKIQILSLSINSANSTKQIIESNQRTIQTKSIHYNKHVIALHDKFVLSLACIVLFFVGAPLGALIRKGGLGLPIVIAIVLFLTYHFFGIFSKNSAEKGGFNPVIGAWLSTLIMLPLSVYLTSRATKDKGVFQFDFIIVPIAKLFSKNKYLNLSETHTKIYNKYTKLTAEELVNIFRNNEDKSNRTVALHALINKKLAFNELETLGLSISDKLKVGKKLIKTHALFSKLSLISFVILTVLVLTQFVILKNKFEEVNTIFLYINAIVILLYTVFFVFSFVQWNKIHNKLDKKLTLIQHLLFIISILLYPINFIITKNNSKILFYNSCLKLIK